MSELDRSAFVEFAARLVKAAASEILPRFGDRGVAVERKSDRTPVTEADRGAEALMRRMIAESFPEHGVIGEEYGEDRPDAPFVWVLDPIDGTQSFISGVPLFTTLAALQFEGRPVVGAIHQPVLGELMTGDGTTTLHNGRAVTARACASPGDATLLTSDPAAPLTGPHARGWQSLVGAVRLYRSWGDAYGYMRVAAGFADIMADPELEIWDKAALLPVLEGAGVCATDWRGGDPLAGRSLLAAAPGVHGAVIAMLNPRAAS